MSKKGKNGKALLQPRIVLDAEVLAAINEYYASYLGDTFIGLECFSHPSLERHVCNVHANSPGSESCEHCSNIQGRRCPITCDIHWFCLATYAVRLGIGVTSRTNGLKSVVHNLNKLTYKELHKLVMDRHEKIAGHLEVVPQKIPLKDHAQLDLVLGDPKPVTQSTKRLSEITHDNDGEELLTLFVAANLYGCEHSEMYNLVNRGAISHIEHAGAVFVKKAEVLKLKELKKVSDE